MSEEGVGLLERSIVPKEGVEVESVLDAGKHDPAPQPMIASPEDTQKIRADFGFGKAPEKNPEKPKNSNIFRKFGRAIKKLNPFVPVNQVEISGADSIEPPPKNSKSTN